MEVNQRKLKRLLFDNVSKAKRMLHQAENVGGWRRSIIFTQLPVSFRAEARREQHGGGNSVQ